MSFSVDVVNLILYSAQQLGVMLGVGSASILLVAYLVSVYDGTIDPKEEQFGRAVTRVQTLGLWIIILSGLVITAMHISGGALGIVLSPAFLFKWLLIALLFGASLFRQNKPYPSYIWEGIIGANWYALFIVHIIAPVTNWVDLFIIYILCGAAFVLCYMAIFRILRAPSLKQRQKLSKPAAVTEKKVIEPKKEAPKPVPKSTPPPQPKPAPVVQQKPTASPPQPKPVVPKPVPPPTPVAAKPAPIPPMPERPHAPLPIVAQSHELAVAPRLPKVTPAPVMPIPVAPTLSVPIKPAPIKPTGQDALDPDENPGLPAIRVMPRTPQDVDKQNRASTVQF
ncbi:MAG TPA: hypothetical protein VHD31_02765 [Candidatus Paceibacterota bacterium]|nr:hypothetical protein [Candidatus Paceibacterota bacterium]